MEWYFDFISPYAYLQLKRLEALGLVGRMRLTPILFAGLLNHWGQLGPAEIPPKRLFTYRHVSWLARSLGVPFKISEAHPFNPLKLLRLAIHLNVEPPVVARLFDFVWRDGFIPDNAAAWAGLVQELGFESVEAAQAGIDRPEVKAALKSNSDRAIAAGVFGVPTIAIGERLFWGQDATDMALEFLNDPARFESDDRMIAALPAAADRRAASHRSGAERPR
jgi:2-hydroxychromene-2-carboxylate isomerase